MNDKLKTILAIFDPNKELEDLEEIGYITSFTVKTFEGGYILTVNGLRGQRMLIVENE